VAAGASEQAGGCSSSIPERRGRRRHALKMHRHRPFFLFIARQLVCRLLHCFLVATFRPNWHPRREKNKRECVNKGLNKQEPFFMASISIFHPPAGFGATNLVGMPQQPKFVSVVL